MYLRDYLGPNHVHAFGDLERNNFQEVIKKWWECQELKIQLALDRVSREKCFRIIDETIASIDWIEIGTGVIKEYGMSIVRDVKERYPQTPLLVDMKTCDAGKHEAIQAFDAGSDMMTVMAFAADQTIIDTINKAQIYGKQIMIDLLGIQTRKRVEELVSMGANLFCLHIGKDMQESKKVEFKELFQLIDGIEGIKVAIAGGFNKETAKDIKGFPVDILIVGSAITESKNPMCASKEIAEVFL